LKDIQKLTRQTIASFDRRNDRVLGAVTAATTSGPSAEQSLPQAKARPQNGQHRSAKPHNHRPNGHQGQPSGGNGNRNRRRGGGGGKGPANGAARPAWNPLQA
jgi:ATP-dependent RNA helicase RhlE